MTSLRQETGAGGEALAAIRAGVAARLAEAFELEPIAISLERLDAALVAA
jgi:hypothetical protein